eukprot:1069663-Rhodomonas_salina.1
MPGTSIALRDPERLRSSIPSAGLPGLCPTELAYGGIFLRASYALAGTELASGGIGLRACYAICGTEAASGGTRCDGTELACG